MRRGLRAPAEAAAGQHGLDFDLLRFQPEHAGDRSLLEGLELTAEPRQRLVIAEPQIAVERLHGRMREIRENKLDLDYLCGF